MMDALTKLKEAAQLAGRISAEGQMEIRLILLEDGIQVAGRKPDGFNSALGSLTRSVTWRELEEGPLNPLHATVHDVSRELKNQPKW